MNTHASSRAPVTGHVPSDITARLRDLDDRGEMLEAHALIETRPPIESWRDPAAVRVAARICEELGAPKRARRIELGMYRLMPKTTAGMLARARATLRFRGPLAAWLLTSRTMLSDDATAAERAELLLVRAHASAALRDFATAQRTIDEAAPLAANALDVTMVRASVAMQMDRYQEALAYVTEVRRARPEHRNALHAAAHLQQLTGDPTAAIAMLRTAPITTKVGSLALHLATLLEELKRFDEASEWIERWVALSPLREDPDDAATRRADCAYHRGDVASALRHLDGVKAPFHARVRSQLERNEESCKRVSLDVPFVRQHNLTCAPATLAAIGAFWKKSVDHLSVAEEICYDGTPNHAERRWAEEHGWVAREFTVTLDTTRALLDHGLPFTISTFGVTGGHLQAVVGYDDRRGTLLIRDPFFPAVVEASAEPWLEEWAPTGPRGLALVPSDEGARLDGIDFHDTPLYDAHHRLNVALYAHDRSAAIDARAELEALAPDHRITLAARRAIAAYDGDDATLLECAEEQLRRFPNFVRAELEAIACMAVLAPRADRIARLDRMVATRDADPVVAETLARELVSDARERERAARLLRRSVRARPQRGAPVALLGSIAIADRRVDEANDLLRIGACLDEYDERAAMGFFVCAQAHGHGDEARALLEERATRLGQRDSQSVRTLIDALLMSGDAVRANAILEAALRDHPDDADLALSAAQTFATSGDVERAQALLARAQGHTRLAVWLRVAATVALRARDYASRLSLLERAVVADPTDVDTQRAVAIAILGARGMSAAIEHVAAVAQRFPHHRELAALHIEWISRIDPKTSVDALRRMVARDPNDAWAQREVALRCMEIGETEAARAALDVAEKLEPNLAVHHHIRGEVLRAAGDEAGARNAFRAAARIAPDRPGVVKAWIEIARGPKARARALEEAETLVREQSVNGDGVRGFFAIAATCMPPADLLARLERIKLERPTLFAAASCVARQLVGVGRHDDALATARDTAARFPLNAAAWLDVAECALFACDENARRDALDRALAIDPLSDTLTLEIVRLRRRQGDAAGALALLADAIERSPDAIDIRLSYATALARNDQREQAVVAARTALALDPGNENAWSLIWKWTEAGNAQRNLLDELSEFAASRPWSTSTALLLARAKMVRGDVDGALATVEAAIAKSPRNLEAHDVHVELHASRQSREQAEIASAPAVFGDKIPFMLRGRHAWIASSFDDVPRAIREMDAIVARHPDYLWGWLQLAEWHEQLGAARARRDVARRCLEIAPRDARVRTLHAHTLLEAGDRDGAKADFARVLDLAPDSVAAAFERFDLHVYDDECAKAESLLPYFASEAAPALRGAEVQVRVRRHDDDGALDAFRTMAFDAKVEVSELYRARRQLIYGGLGERVHELTSKWLAHVDAHREIGVMWARTQMLRDRGRIDDALTTLDMSTPAARAVVIFWFDEAREQNQITRIRWAARTFMERFRAHTDTWGAIGYGLLMADTPKAARLWLADWRDRGDARPWMLLNVAAAHRAEGDEATATEAHRRAVASDTRDGSTPAHLAWLALAEATEGDIERARWALAQAKQAKLGDIERKVAVLADAVLAARDPHDGKRRAGTQYARKKLASIGVTTFQRGRSALVSAQRRASRRVAREMDGVTGVIWFHRAAILVWLAIVGSLSGALGITLVGSEGEWAWLLFAPAVVIGYAIKWWRSA